MFGPNNTSLFSSTPTNQQQSYDQTKQQKDLMATKQKVTVAIRKQERDKQIMKRRKMNSTASTEQTVSMNPFQQKVREQIFEQFRFTNREYSIAQIVELSDSINSKDLERVYYGMIGIRKLLSVEKEPPIQMIIDANLVSRIIECAKQNEQESLKAEATWALTNIASGTSLQTQSVIDKGGIQLFVELLKSNNELVLQQAVWAVANIAADRQSYRDTFIREGVVNVLCNLIENCSNLKIVTNASWALSNMIRTKPTPKFDQISKSLKSLGLAVKHGKLVEEKVFQLVLAVLSSLIEYNSSRISILLQTQLSPKLFQLLSTQSKQVLCGALKLIGTIIYSNQTHLHIYIQNGLLDKLQILLDHPKKLIKKQVCWILSNISTNTDHLKVLLTRESIINKLYQLLIKQDITTNIKKQIGRFFTHIAHAFSTIEIITFFHNHKFIQIYLTFIRENAHADLVEMGLNGIAELLRVGEENKKVTGGKSVMMEDFVGCEGIDILEDAQMHPKIAIYEQAACILRKYFELDDPLAT